MRSLDTKLNLLHDVALEDGREQFEYLLMVDEIVELSYKGLRDRLIFTNKRLVVMDSQGIMGKKKEFTFITYSKIAAFALETSGPLDYDTEFKIWLRGNGGLELSFVKGTDIARIANFLSLHIS